jgi:hypothetical protein
MILDPQICPLLDALARLRAVAAMTWRAEEHAADTEGVSRNTYGA